MLYQTSLQNNTVLDYIMDQLVYALVLKDTDLRVHTLHAFAKLLDLKD